MLSKKRGIYAGILLFMCALPESSVNTILPGTTKNIMSPAPLYGGYEDYYVKKGRKTRKKSKYSSKSRTRKKQAPRKKSKKYIYYTIKKGDALSKIARKFKVSQNALISLNNIKKKSVIYAGMKLKIPTDKKNSSSSKIQKNKYPWPLQKVYSCKRDGSGHVKAIGVIIKTKKNARVHSIDRGIIKRIGYMRGFGRYIVIKHSKSITSVYSYMGKIRVREGQRIGTGEILGTVENRNLHFQIARKGKPENPLKYLSRRKYLAKK